MSQLERSRFRTSSNALWLIFCAAAVACGGDADSDPVATSTATTSATGGGGMGTGGHSTGGETSTASGGSAAGGGTTTGGGGGCPMNALAAGDHQGTIDFDGNTREYEVHVPASYDNTTPIPIVFDLHGFTSNANQQKLISGWQQEADARGFAVIRPEGYGALQSWNGGDTCCGTALSSGLDDVGLMKALLAEMQAQLCIDDARVYATGLSNGGAMSHRLACDAADVFAAVAPVAYPIAYLPISKCQPSQPIGVMHSHGTGDMTVAYDGQFGVASAPDSFAQWGSANGCSGNPVETYRKGSSYCDTYDNCNGGVEVTLCTVDGPHFLYSNNDDVPIAELAWDFFTKHTRR